MRVPLINRPTLHLLLLAILGTALAGCGGEGEATSSANGGASAHEAQTPAPQQSTTEQTAEQTTDTAPAGSAMGSTEADAPSVELSRVALADLRRLIDETAEQDRVLVIDFWATWCIPCVQIFPELHERLKGLGEAVRPVSVTLDDPESEANAIEFLRKHDAMQDAYMLMPDSDAQVAIAKGIGERWNDLVVPAILVYNARGELVGEYLDTDARPDVILQGVEAALRKKPSNEQANEQGSVDAEDG